MARILMIASGAGLAPPVLQALRSAHDVVGLVTPAPVSRPRGRVLLAPDVVAAAGDIPVHGVERTTDPWPLLAALRPDAVVVACFPWRLAEPWWTAPPRGAINVHPSLLPLYRGPIPLFWQYRAGDERTGVTLHRVDAGLDTGPVLAQRLVPLADDLDMDGAERALGRVAGLLLLDVLASDPQALAQGDGTYHGWPAEQDFVIGADWSPRRVQRFTRLVGGRFPLRRT